MADIWTVPATVLDVIDATTLKLRLDLGWHLALETRCTLIGIHVPDISTEEGQAARRWVIEKLGFGGPESVAGWTVEVTFVSHELGSRGTSRGQILVTTPQGASFDLGLELMNAGHAEPMVG